MTDKVKVEGLDSNGNKVEVFVKKPGNKDFRDSRIAYNQEFRKALEGGAILKAKLAEYVREQGIWDEKKDKQYDDLIEQVRQLELTLKKGGIPLSKAKDAALKLHKVRLEFRALIAEKQSHEANTAESLAENAQFNSLVSSCVVRENGSKVWDSIEKYDEQASEPWAVQAAAELAKLLYGIDPDYDKNLVENQFLVKYKFANNDLRLVNKDGHLVDENGKLIDEDGRYVAYRDDGTKYFVNFDGQEVDDKGNVKVEFAPFTDDDGNEIKLEENA
jgi:hypothetical protein